MSVYGPYTYTSGVVTTPVPYTAGYSAFTVSAWLTYSGTSVCSPIPCYLFSLGRTPSSYSNELMIQVDKYGTIYAYDNSGLGTLSVAAK